MLYSLDNYAHVRTLTPQRSNVSAVAATVDGGFLVLGLVTGEVLFLDHNYNVAHSLTGHAKAVTGITVLPR